MHESSRLFATDRDDQKNARYNNMVPENVYGFHWDDSPLPMNEFSLSLHVLKAPNARLKFRERDKEECFSE